MSLLFVVPHQNLDVWKEELLAKDPDLEIEVWPFVKNKEAVTFAVCWNQPKYLLDSYPNLQAVSSLGAGVDHLLRDDSLSSDIPIARLVTDSLKEQMADYALNAISGYRYHSNLYAEQKQNIEWKKHPAIPKRDCAVGIMGLGELGIATAQLLAKNRYKVSGWSKSKKSIDGITCYSESEKEEFLSQINILICLLPLTPATEGILDLDVFSAMKKSSYLINMGRGEHLVEEDLVYALDTDELAGACLDVFEKEPLPDNHIFWNRKNITITPHIAGISDPVEGSEILLENYKLASSGMKMINQIDRETGY